MTVSTAARRKWMKALLPVLFRSAAGNSIDRIQSHNEVRLGSRRAREDEANMDEFDIKQQRIMKLLADHNLDGLILKKTSSFAWATCGAASHINLASSIGEAALVITPSHRFLVTNNIESPRLKQEEKLEEQGWEFVVASWYAAQDTFSKLTVGLKVGADVSSETYVDLSRPMARVRANLTPMEGERFRHLGNLCADAMRAAIHKVQPGQTEYEIGSFLVGEAERRGVQVVVNLIATDGRIFNFRHPLPTSKKLDRYAMLILCGRKYGLICSLTRLVHFGALPAKILKKAHAVAKIEAALIASTRPGASLGEIFQTAIDRYAAVGFPDEWHLHHQGGPTGYEPREYIAVPGLTDQVEIGQAFTWNPSITGTKSEDTFLVGEHENEILTMTATWPTYTVEINGKTYERPAIMEL